MQSMAFIVAGAEDVEFVLRLLLHKWLELGIPGSPIYLDLQIISFHHPSDLKAI